MSKIKQDPIPTNVIPVLKRSGLKIKNYRSASSFEKVLLKFIKRNEVLHLCTSKNDTPRSTPVGYKSRGLTFYILSEGGGKFSNFKKNKQVAFSIAEPYKLAEGFWGYKGLQAWGKAAVYSRKEHPKLFEKAFKAMNMVVVGRKMQLKNLAPEFNHKIIVIEPNRIRYTNPTEGIFRVSWIK
jgi:nitroimidazol reductase NimA-like FMN-containing flavoprotein (pyridoxamine 5'-phosphate oxidase superfamily)